MTGAEMPPQDDAFDVQRERDIEEEFDGAEQPEVRYELQSDGRWHSVADVRGKCLPHGIEHGSVRAVLEGCGCRRCLDRASRMRRRGWRPWD